MTDGTSHRLMKIDGPEGSSLRAYDANGNALSGHLGSESAVYGVDNRLREFVAEEKGAGPNRQWHYNGRGERVATEILAETMVGSPFEFFVYDPSGQIASIVYPEWGQQGPVAIKTTGEPTRYEEVIWLDNTPVARVFSTAASVLSAHAIHSDHLNTPRALSNLQLQGGQPSGTVVWRWNLNQLDANGSNAFGAQADDTNPDGNAVHTTFRLRFPGQLYDQASGLHYNYFRDYEPGTGRYVESDPIGFGGGISTYVFTDANPLILTDQYGLYSLIPLRRGINTVGCDGENASYFFDNLPPSICPAIKSCATLHETVHWVDASDSIGKNLCTGNRGLSMMVADSVAEKHYTECRAHKAERSCLLAKRAIQCEGCDGKDCCPEIDRRLKDLDDHFIPGYCGLRR